MIPSPLEIPEEPPFRLSRARVPAAMLGPDLTRLPLHHEGSADLVIDVAADGTIEQAGPTGTLPPATGPEVDVAFRHLWTPLADIHTHLDKSQSWPRAKNEDGSFDGAKTGAKADRARGWTRQDVAARMDFSLRAAFAHGTRAIRSHLDSQNGRTWPSWDVFAEMRERWAGRITLEGVASLGAQKLMDGYGEEVAALARDHGGCLGPVLYPGPDAPAHVARAFDLAEAYGLRLDFHVDENLDPASDGLRLVAETAMARGVRGVVCGHACSLNAMDRATRAGIIDTVAKAGVTVVALPTSNIYLMDRSTGRSPTCRAMAPALELVAAGVEVAYASDNCRDPFNPLGDNDLVDVFRDGVRLGHTDQTLGEWVHAIGPAPHRMMGLAPPLIGRGQKADFVVFEGRSFSEVLARPGAPRQVIIGGRPEVAPLPSFSELDGLFADYPATGA